MQDGTAIDQAINETIREVVLAHKRAGNPIVVCKDGQIVWIPADEIEV